MIVKDSEWLLAEVGVENFVFVNHMDDTVKLVLQKCRYVVKDEDYVVNLSFQDNSPCMEFTVNTKRRVAPSLLRNELLRVLNILKRNYVKGIDLLKFIQ